MLKTENHSNNYNGHSLNIVNRSEHFREEEKSCLNSIYIAASPDSPSFSWQSLKLLSKISFTFVSS